MEKYLYCVGKKILYINKTRRTLFIEEFHLNVLLPQGIRNLIKDIVPYDFYIYFYLAQWHYYF